MPKRDSKFSASLDQLPDMLPLEALDAIGGRVAGRAAVAKAGIAPSILCLPDVSH